MALTGSITTGDGVIHPNVFAKIYPIQLQTLDGDGWLKMTVHVWHSQAAKDAGASELGGYPATLEWHGDAFLAKLVATLGGFGAIEWSENPVEAALQAEAAIITALEAAACEQLPWLVQV